MAKVKTIKGSSILIKVGGTTGGPYAHPCIINSTRGIAFSAETNDAVVPDCANPEASAWTERDKSALSATITGEGLINTPDVEKYFGIWKNRDAVACQVVMDVAAVDGGGQFEGYFILTEFELTGARGERSTASMTWVSDGEITWADAEA